MYKISPNINVIINYFPINTHVCIRNVYILYTKYNYIQNM